MSNEQLDRTESKLDFILSWINKMDSKEHSGQQDAKSFIINVAADLFVENLHKEQNENTKT